MIRFKYFGLFSRCSVLYTAALFCVLFSYSLSNLFYCSEIRNLKSKHCCLRVSTAWATAVPVSGLMFDRGLCFIYSVLSTECAEINSGKLSHRFNIRVVKQGSLSVT